MVINPSPETNTGALAILTDIRREQTHLQANVPPTSETDIIERK
jgi:hypothetical protein